jgi:glycosyltransferase involved in cell wall biosynthesis
MPRVSIGLPVFNGENFIKSSIDSILRQTFEDFELIISDNSSNDKTKEICIDYTAKDKRIRYHRNDKNIGASKNFNLTFNLSTGEYFKWAAHDDLIMPDFLQECVDVLDRETGVVLCHSRSKLIDRFGNVIKKFDREMNNLDSNALSSPNPLERFNFIITNYRFCLDIFGLIRTKSLETTPLIADYIASDKNLLAELALTGRFYQIPKYLFFSRDHSERSVKATGRYSKSRAIWFDPANKKYLIFPQWRCFLEYARSLKRLYLRPREQITCIAILGNWLFLNKRRLIKELIIRE